MSQIKQISPRVRVEPGPVVREEECTEALLADEKTAKHYQLTPKDPATGDFYRDDKGGHIGSRDAIGRPIELGKPMRYLDYRGPRVWKIYLWEDHDDHRQGGWYAYVEEHPEYEDAIMAATKLAAKEGDL